MAKKLKIKRSWVYAALTLVVIAYLVTMWVVVAGKSASRPCTGILITVHDTARYRFVNPEELARELGTLPDEIAVRPLSEINIDSLERYLAAFDKIESVNVNLLSDGHILIDVYPMKPVARIFSTDGSRSYYINRSGKRIVADARYHLDVPVVAGDFTPSRFPATSILPLVDYIRADSMLSALVTMIKVDSPTDIILVPAIRGHVINIGDTLGYPDKFRRLKTMYAKVMGVKGWEYYDTLSVKWNGQIVATRRDKSLPAPLMVVETENAEEVDIETMAPTPGIAPGQALPGTGPSRNDKPVPGRKLLDKVPVATPTPATPLRSDSIAPENNEKTN